MKKTITILGFLAGGLLAAIALYSVGYYLGQSGSGRSGGSLAVDNLRSCTYTSVNVSTTRQMALDAFSGRGRISLGNSTTTVASYVWYIMSNTSTSVSTSSARFIPGTEERVFDGAWKGQVWLLSNSATAIPVSIEQCY